jgi:hypothetical protein
MDAMDARARFNACISALLLVALASVPAFANGFHVTYSAPHGCPDRTEFVRAIEQRVPNWQHRDGPVERELELTVQRTEGGFAGRLSLGTAENAREVEGAECASVVRALALVAAISLDPAATSGPGEPIAPPARDQASAPATRLPVEPARVPATPSRAPNLSWGFGASGALLFGIAPSVLYGVEVHVELGDSHRRLLLRAAGAQLVTGSIAIEENKATFELTAAELGGCYRPLDLDTFDLSGCLVVNAGQLRAEGERGGEVVDPGTSRRFWGASGARFGAFLRPVRSVELGAELGVLVPWYEHSYVLDNPRERVHDTAPVAVDARLGVTVIVP